MSFRYNNIFNIPERNLVQQRLTKAFFLRIAGLNAAEKKLINNDIRQMEIIAQLIPEKSNIPAVISEKDSFEQVLLVRCSVSENQLERLTDKCIQLIQKHIQHQLVVIVEDDNSFKINLAVKRINQNDKSKLTVEKYFTTNTLSKLYKNDLSDAFYKALDFGNLDKTNLELLYKSYIQAVVQFQAASITGNYQKRTNTRTQEDMKHLEAIAQLEQDIVSLTSQIKKASQLNEKVQLNISIKKKRDRIDEIKQILAAHS